MKIFFVNLRGIEFNDNLFDKYREFLSEEELERLNKIQRAESKRNFIFGRFLIRSNLSKLLNCDAREIDLRKTKNGRLELVDKNYGRHLSFNISHSKDFVFLAISESKIGIDVEIKKKRDLESISNFLFDENEVKALENVKNTDRENLFYSYWTLKESFVKCRGESILDGDLAFSLEIEDGKIETNNIDDFKFLTYLVSEKYIMSITVESSKISEVAIEELMVGKDEIKTSLNLILSS